MTNKSSFLVMTLSVVGLVLWITLFSTIITAIDTLAALVYLDNFTALETVIDIAPVVLLLGGIFSLSFAYYKGYQGAQAQDASGIMRMVLGVILIILFVTLFATIMTAMQALAVAVNSSGYTALTTVVSIAPVVLFLSGIFAGAATGVSGAKAYKRRRRSSLPNSN